MGDDEGRAHGVFNVCRHRGARLVSEPEGTMRRLQCPYHAWCYGFDGALKSAPHTDEIENFDPANISLTAVRMEERHGLLFADVSGTAGPLDDHLGDLTQHLERYRVGDLERHGAITYDVESNWKAIVENYSECLHCPGVHPELNRLSHYLSGDEYYGAGAWCGGSMTLNEGAETMAQNGGHVHRPAIKGLTEKEQRDVLYFALFPNLLVSLHPDYVMVHTLWPRGPGRTEVVCEWYFEPETAAMPELRPVRRGRLLGHGQPPGLGGVRARATRDRLARSRPGPLHGQRDDRPRLRPARGRGVPVAVTERSARERILDAAVERIAGDGIDAVRIARIAMDARVSTALVHYHFATREALLAEALEHSFETAGEVREESSSDPVIRLKAMIEQCLPLPGELERDWVLWVELWLRAVRHPELRPTAAKLYARMNVWFRTAIEEGDFGDVDAGAIADRTLAMIDGFGVRALLGDPDMPLERARAEVWHALAGDLGLRDEAPSGYVH